MSLTISTTTSGKVAVLTCNGRMVLGTSADFREAVTTALRNGTLDIVLDLAEVPYIDSSGIGELVSAYTTTRNSGGNLVLAALTKRVHDLLQITKLYSVFPVFDTREAALEHLSSTPTAPPESPRKETDGPGYS